MTEKTVELDLHRGMAAQKATEERRRKQDVADNHARIKVSQDVLEHFLFAAPAADWKEAAEKMRYLLSLFAATAEGQDTRVQIMIANLISDIAALTGSDNRAEAPEPANEGE